MMNTEYEPTDDELLAMASQFDVYLDAEKQALVRVVPRRHNGYIDWVAINQEKFIFNHSGGWEFQPIFAGGDDDFLYHTGWDHPRAVIGAIRKAEAQISATALMIEEVVEAEPEASSVEEENG